MNIIYLRSAYADPDPRVEKEISSLLKNKYNISVVCWDRNKNYLIRKSTITVGKNSVPVLRFGIKAPLGAGMSKIFFQMLYFQLCLFVLLCVKRKKYRIIHAADFDTVIPALIVAKVLNKKLIYDIYDYYADSHSAPKPIKNVIRYLENMSIKHADATIICSEKRVEQIKGTKPKYLAVIHNSPKYVDMPRSKIKNSNSKIKLIYVGCLSEGRFIREMIEVILLHKDWELHIGGYGLLSNYIEEISRKHNNIIFYGMLSYAKVLYLESQMHILTAIYDPAVKNHQYAAPNKFYEALMLGKPLIMLKNTGVDCILKDEKIGEVIDIEKDGFHLGFEKAVSNLIFKQDEWDSIAERMRYLYNSRFSWEIMERRLLALYEALI